MSGERSLGLSVLTVVCRIPLAAGADTSEVGLPGSAACPTGTHQRCQVLGRTSARYGCLQAGHTQHCSARPALGMGWH